MSLKVVFLYSVIRFGMKNEINDKLHMEKKLDLTPPILPKVIIQLFNTVFVAHHQTSMLFI